MSVVTVGVFKNRAIYWNGGETQRGLACQSQTFLLWHVIKHLKSTAVSHFEVGEVSPRPSVDKKGSIGLFKKSFGGEFYPLYQGTLYCDKWGPIKRHISGLRKDLGELIRSAR